jgi:hypothetical protein
MPYEVNYENAASGVCISWTGHVTGSEIFAVNKFIYARERVSMLRYQIWDFSQVAPPELSFDQLRDIALQDRRAFECNPDMISAIVGNVPYFSSMVRTLEVFVEVWDIGFPRKTFEQMAAARAWIVQELPELQT